MTSRSETAIGRSRQKKNRRKSRNRDEEKETDRVKGIGAAAETVK